MGRIEKRAPFLTAAIKALAFTAVLIVIAGWMAKTVDADSNTERQLRSHIAALESDLKLANQHVETLTEMNAQLLRKVSETRVSPSGVATLSNTINAATRTLADRQAQQAQEVAAVLEKVHNKERDEIISAQKQFAKQLALAQTDTRNVTKSQQREMYLLVILTIIVLAFTGVIVYSSQGMRGWRVPDDKGN